jgi:ubiquitin-conjugating enzyme E2 D/E
MSASTKRIQKELRDLLANPSEGCAVEPTSTDQVHPWSAVVTGPEGSPYEDGGFDLLVVFPDDYPFNPPKVTFVTPIYHLNINEQGAIGLGLLGDGWSPASSISQVLTTIRGLLVNPDQNRPLRPDLANLFAHDPLQYAANARAFTTQHAAQ